MDESHYLKSLTAVRTRAILGKNALLTRVSGPTWALSGTPAPNHPGELWPLLFTFGATALRYQDFISKFCEVKTLKFNHRVINQITGTKKANIPALREILAPVMLRLTKEEAMLELPPLKFEMLAVAESKVDLEIADFVEYSMLEDRTKDLFAALEKQAQFVNLILDKTENSGVETWGEGVGQAVSTLRRYTGMQKLKSIADIISEELEEGAYDKIVIFAVHQCVIDGLRMALRNFGAVTIYGKTPYEKRQENLALFKNPHSDCRVLIGNIQAMGTAITLTNAHQVLFAECSWVPGENAQAAMRCHRIGQTKPVTVRITYLPESIDERVNKILRRKTEELTEIFDPQSYMNYRLPEEQKKVSKKSIDDKPQN